MAGFERVTIDTWLVVIPQVRAQILIGYADSREQRWTPVRIKWVLRQNI